jgi:hypothetical protein
MVAIGFILQPGESLLFLDPTSLNVTILPNGTNYTSECRIVQPQANNGYFVNSDLVVAWNPVGFRGKTRAPADVLAFAIGWRVAARAVE